jgi:hypothetical protein
VEAVSVMQGCVDVSRMGYLSFLNKYIALATEKHCPCRQDTFIEDSDIKFGIEISYL